MSPAPDHREATPNGLPTGPLKGRGSGVNPGNRFETISLHVLGDHLDHQAREQACGESGPPRVPTQIIADASRTVLNKVVDSPDIPFAWTVNPYRGCEHGCIYCYARPTHEYLGFSCGLDFETRIVAKHDAPGLLRAALLKPSWKGEAVVMSGVTDPYQPVERELGITRGCLEVMRDLGQSVGIITKNRLITRDIDILADMAASGLCQASISVTSLDNALAAKLEPRASAPRERLAAIRELADAGIPVAVMTAPIIPGLNDKEIPALLEAARDAGATSAGWVMLRLPWQVKDLFLDWLRRHVPDRAAHVESLIRQTRGGVGGTQGDESRRGKLYDSTPFLRQRGQGPVADQIAQLFKVCAARHGLNRGIRATAYRATEPARSGAGSVPPSPPLPPDDPQLSLFPTAPVRPGP